MNALIDQIGKENQWLWDSKKSVEEKKKFLLNSGKLLFFNFREDETYESLLTRFFNKHKAENAKESSPLNQKVKKNIADIFIQLNGWAPKTIRENLKEDSQEVEKKVDEWCKNQLQIIGNHFYYKINLLEENQTKYEISKDEKNVFNHSQTYFTALNKIDFEKSWTSQGKNPLLNINKLDLTEFVKLTTKISNAITACETKEQNFHSALKSFVLFWKNPDLFYSTLIKILIGKYEDSFGITKVKDLQNEEIVFRINEWFQATKNKGPILEFFGTLSQELKDFESAYVKLIKSGIDDRENRSKMYFSRLFFIRLMGEIMAHAKKEFGIDKAFELALKFYEDRIKIEPNSLSKYAGCFNNDYVKTFRADRNDYDKGSSDPVQFGTFPDVKKSALIVILNNINKIDDDFKKDFIENFHHYARITDKQEKNLATIIEYTKSFYDYSENVDLCKLAFVNMLITVDLQNYFLEFNQYSALEEFLKNFFVEDEPKNHILKHFIRFINLKLSAPAIDFVYEKMKDEEIEDFLMIDNDQLSSLFKNTLESLKIMKDEKLKDDLKKTLKNLLNYCADEDPKPIRKVIEEGSQNLNQTENEKVFKNIRESVIKKVQYFEWLQLQKTNFKAILEKLKVKGKIAKVETKFAEQIKKALTTTKTINQIIL